MKNDETTTIKYLKEKIQQLVSKEEWSKYHRPKDLAVSIAIEASELLELFQLLTEENIDDLLKDTQNLRRVEEELADVIIFCLSLANVIDVDIARTVTKKLEKSEIKYPKEL